MNVNDTVRITRDNPNEAEIRAGECGQILAVKEARDGVVFTVKVGRKVWQILADDCEPVNVAAEFGALMADLDLDTLAEMSRFYDEDIIPKMDGVPEEPGLNVPEPERGTPVGGRASGAGSVRVRNDEDDDEDDDDDGETCHPGPHIHEDDGTVVPLPFLKLTDEDGDAILAVDITEASKDSSAPDRVLSVRGYRHDGVVTEVHLTEAQGLALGAFLFRRYGPNRS